VAREPRGCVGPLRPGPGKFPTVVRVDTALAFTLGKSEHQRASWSASRRLPGWFFPTQVCSGFDFARSGSYAWALPKSWFFWKMWSSMGLELWRREGSTGLFCRWSGW